MSEVEEPDMSVASDEKKRAPIDEETLSQIFEGLYPHATPSVMGEILECEDAGTPLKPHLTEKRAHIGDCEQCRSFFEAVRQMRAEGWKPLPPEEIIRRLGWPQLAESRHSRQ